MSLKRALLPQTCTFFSRVFFFVFRIIEVISTAPYLTDKCEHTALNKINK